MWMKGEWDFVGGDRLTFRLGNAIGLGGRKRQRRRGEGQASEWNWQVVARSSVGKFPNGRRGDAWRCGKSGFGGLWEKWERV